MKIRFSNNKALNLLFLGAHCDDIEIGAGGSILKLIQEYEIGQITWIVFSSTEERKKEAQNSAGQFLKEVSTKKVIVETFRDGFFPWQGAEMKEYFEKLKKTISPDVIFTHYRDDRHQDHRVISDLTWNTWRNHLILEYEIPKYDGDLGIPNFYIALEEKYINRKNQILLDAFQTQSTKHWFDESTFSALPRLRGMESATNYAEAFYVRKLVF